MKAISGFLKANKEYILIDIFKSEPTPCDNCGTIITNLYEIHDNENKKYYVGSECINTVQRYCPSIYFSLIEKEKEYRRKMKYINLVRAGEEVLKIENGKYYIGWKSFDFNKAELDFINTPIKKAKKRTPRLDIKKTYILDSFGNYVKNEDGYNVFQTKKHTADLKKYLRRISAVGIYKEIYEIYKPKSFDTYKLISDFKV